MASNKNKLPDSNDVYTVSRLNRHVKSVLEDVFPAIWVQGEISNLAKPASGHLYFILKDSSAQVRCAMFKNRQSGMRFNPENGMQVMARANVGLFEGRGEYQLIIETLKPTGAGALQIAFETLKQKLAAEGLFAEAHKKPCPQFPKTIGIITSKTGAAVQDILSVLKRRYPYGKVIIFPVPVQGAGSAIKIAEAINLADQRKACDVLILARGGGAIEDLWSFNEAVVARAIFDAVTPIVSGVGHEVDFTIADFVADYRASTPSTAAALVSPDCAEVMAKLQHHEARLIHRQKQYIQNLQRRVELLSMQLPHPQQRLTELMQRTDAYAMRIKYQIENSLSERKIELSRWCNKINALNPAHTIYQQIETVKHRKLQFEKAIMRVLEKYNSELSRLAQILQTVSPIATLERGYAIVTTLKTGAIIKNTNNLCPGDELRIRLAKADIDSTINKIHEK